MADEKRNEMAPLWTDEDVAAFLQVSVGTVRKWAKEGTIPVRKAGALNRFDRTEIEDWTMRRREAEETPA